MGDTMLNLYVLDAVSSEKLPAEIDPASKEDLAATHDWQTSWESTYARQLPNKVALPELLHAEESGAASGWVSPLSQEDREYFAYLRKVFKRYNITPSKATRLEYDFVIRVAESEFYLQKANA